MEPQIVAAFIGAGATGVAALVGFGAVVSQIKKQAEVGRQAILDAEKRRIKSQMLDEGIVAARAVADAAIDFTSLLRAARMQIEVAAVMHAEGQSYSIPGTRVPVIMDSNNAMTEAILRFVFLLENRRIIDERLIVFRDVLNATLHDLRGLYNFDLLGAMMDALPLEDPNGIIQPYSPPGREKLPALFDLIDRTIKQGTRPISYMEDFIVEIQNLMLGEIFTKPVEHRYPLDGAEIVVRLDQFEEIYRWLGQTPWGSEYAAIEERVRQKFAGDGGIPANSLTRSG